MPDDKPINFHLEVHCEPVPNDVIELAIMIRDSSQSSLEIKLLAKIALQQMYFFNKLVESLEYGTVTVSVKPKDIRHRD